MLKTERRLFWRIFLGYLLLIVMGIFLVGGLSLGRIKTFYLHNIERGLEARANLAAQVVGPLMLDPDGEEIDALTKGLGHASSTRITVTDPSGFVLGDSERSPKTIDNLYNRPEVLLALQGDTGESTHFSETLMDDMKYVAVPIKAGETNGNEPAILGVVRVALPLNDLYGVLNTVYIQITLLGVGVALVAAFLGLYITRRITKPMEIVKRGAERFASGDLDHRLSIQSRDEIGDVAEALNHMAAEIGEKTRLVVHQRNEIEAVLASMVEGVIAIDKNSRILRVNEAVSTLLDLAVQDAAGMSLEDLTSNQELIEIAHHVLKDHGAIEREIDLLGDRARLIQVSASVLRDHGGRRMGALIVLNDVSRLRRLERVRSDFVANVSHELRTPITSIKGFAETLRGGSTLDAKTAARYLEIISRHTDRLNQTIEDLLAIAQIEQAFETQNIDLKEGMISDAIQMAVRLCESKAWDKGIRLRLKCENGLKARFNDELLEQAVINLIENSINYSSPESHIAVEGTAVNNHVEIRVSDEGCGIAPEDQKRIFERFYCVDKSHSHELGGTGLGLSIVKNVALVHGGTVTVQSAPGQGSTFTIHLPIIS